LPDDEPVKRAPAGSGRAPVASGTGAEAPAAAGCVGAAPVASGRLRWRRASSGWLRWCRARTARRGGRGGRRERAMLGRRRLAAAAVARRQRHGGGGGLAAYARVRMKRCALGRGRLKLFISDGTQEAVGHKLMSDGQSDSRRLFSVIFDGRCWPSDITLCPTVA
jgi:hypothetical protein